MVMKRDEDGVENLEMTRRVCWSVCLCWCSHDVTCTCPWKKSSSADSAVLGTHDAGILKHPKIRLPCLGQLVRSCNCTHQESPPELLHLPELVCGDTTAPRTNRWYDGICAIQLHWWNNGFPSSRYHDHEVLCGTGVEDVPLRCC